MSNEKQQETKVELSHLLDVDEAECIAMIEPMYYDGEPSISLYRIPDGRLVTVSDYGAIRDVNLVEEGDKVLDDIETFLRDGMDNWSGEGDFPEIKEWNFFLVKNNKPVQIG